jgi:NAD(P)-dependent dehydrogenase (short-subunit alcohol dehydrogenase family)
MTVLVTGATGNVGSAVIRELRDRGVAVRAFVRAPAAELPDGVEVAVGDFDDPASIRSALAGIDRVFSRPVTARGRYSRRLRSSTTPRASTCSSRRPRSALRPDRRSSRSTGMDAARSTCANPASRTSSSAPAST